MVSPFYKQMLCNSSLMVMFFCIGFLLGILSIALPSLRKPDSGVKLTTEQESWIASLYFLMCFPTKFISGYVVDKYGRKCVVVSSIIPLLVTNIMMYLAMDFTFLFISMMVFGLSGGAMIGSIMAAEISSPKYRGFIMTTKMIFLIAGSMVPHSLGQFFNWRSLVLWNCIPAVYGLVVSVTCPESPAWLALQGRFEECKSAFIWFRGNDEGAELQQLIHSQRKALLEKRLEKQKNSSNLTKIKTYIFDKCFLKAAAIGFICVIILEATGPLLFMVYIIDIFVAITGSKDNANYFALAMDMLSIVCVTISCFTMTKFERRKLFFSTGIAAVLFLSLFCLFSFLMTKGFVSEEYSWMKLALLLLFFMMRDIGFISVAGVLWVEVYPLSHRGLGISIGSLVFAVLTFTIAKALPSMLKRFGLQVFLINAVVISLGLIYLYLFLPETSDKTLIDIENEIKGEGNKEYTVCNVEAEENNVYAADKK